MSVDIFDFDLPDERIALRPDEPRDSARLLVIDPNAENRLSDHRVGDLTSFLRAGD
ncbi:S-adenosylmethionine:tRNA ribosyltransferase-isomerase, partial [Rhizobium johnstonii]